MLLHILNNKIDRLRTAENTVERLQSMLDAESKKRYSAELAKISDMTTEGTRSK